MTEADWTDLKVEYLDRAQPKYKRMDLETMRRQPFDDQLNYVYNHAIDDIKSKYGDLWVVIEK